MATDITCRICFEPASRDEVIAPCSCKGSSKWVHRGCLDQWRAMSEDRAFTKCTECLSSYRMISPPDLEDPSVTLWRNIRFSFYCARDITAVLFVVHIFIFFCSSLVYYGDKKRHVLLHFVHCEEFPRVFYYVCGLLVFFACVGFCFLFGLSSHSSRARGQGCCHNDRTSPNCCLCCEVGPRHYTCFDICCPRHFACYRCGTCCEGCSACECGSCECGSCEAGSCHGCDLGGAACKGEGALVFGLVVVCVLASVGIFICAALGIKGVQEISERHIHMLKKRTLVNDFVVCDLAADEECLDVEMGSVKSGDEHDRIPLQLHGSENSEIYTEQNGERNYFSSQQQRTLDRMGLL